MGKKASVIVRAELEQQKVYVKVEDGSYDRTTIAEVTLDLEAFYQLHEFVTFLGEELGIQKMETIL